MKDRFKSTNNTDVVNSDVTASPLVTVVIPTYNHGQFIGEAIESIFAQDYKNYEIVIVDDGSSDNTEEVVRNYKGIRYLKQKNQGLSASRNIGLQISMGEYITFLDADDMLQPNAITTNVQYFTKNKECAFVSGNHKRIAVDGKELAPPKTSYISSNHYEAFLKGNYIGMHGTVMYNKEVLLEEEGFNTSLAACEDYDLYLRLSRKHKIFSHQKTIASYRQHDNNMSSNVSLMLKHALGVLDAQLPHVREKPDLVKAYQNGVKGWKEYYTRQFIKEVKNKKKIWKPMKGSERLFLLKLMTLPYLTFKYNFMLKKMIKPNLKKLLRMSRLTKYKKNHKPAVGKIKWGDLRRTIPISRLYGYDRGGPIDRYYIENFLAKHSNVIRGRVLEVGDNEYTIRFGKENVIKSDVLHLHAENPKATFVGDLSNADHIPSEIFDCIVLTQTLHLIYDYKKALKNCYRILKPGGTILLTVPGIVQIEEGEWGKYWLWSFTNISMGLIFKETFPQSKLEIEEYGNVLSATGLLQGIGVNEVTKKELDDNDPLYQVVISVKATK